MAERRRHERWAHLRFSVIGQLLAAPPPKGALRGELEKLAARGDGRARQGESTWKKAGNTAAVWVGTGNRVGGAVAGG